MIARTVIGQESQATAKQQLVALKVVIAALIGGLLVFAGLVLAIARAGDGEGDDVLLVVAAAVLAAGMVASALAPRFLLPRYRARRLSEDDELARAFFELTVVRAALLEGPGFLCLVVYLLSGRPLVLAGAAVALLLLAALYPSAGAWDRFRAAVAGDGDRRFDPR